MAFKMKHKRSAFPFKDVEGTGTIEPEQQSAETDATSKMAEMTPGRDMNFQREQGLLSSYSGQQGNAAKGWFNRTFGSGGGGDKTKEYQGVGEHKSQRLMDKRKHQQIKKNQRGRDKPLEVKKAYNPSLDNIAASREARAKMAEEEGQNQSWWQKNKVGQKLLAGSMGMPGAITAWDSIAGQDWAPDWM